VVAATPGPVNSALWPSGQRLRTVQSGVVVLGKVDRVIDRLSHSTSIPNGVLGIVNPDIYSPRYLGSRLLIYKEWLRALLGKENPQIKYYECSGKHGGKPRKRETRLILIVGLR